MKKSIFIIVLLSSFIGCYYSLNIQKDDLTNSSTVTLDIWHSAIEGDLYNYLMRYTKKIQNNKAGSSTIYIQSYQYYNEPLLDENGLIAVDNNIYNVKVTERSTISMGRSILLCGKIAVPDNIENEIINCKEFKIRVYALEKPTTYKANKNELEKVKEFFKIK